MYASHGAFFFRPAGGKAVHLGRDVGTALAQYGAMVSGQWSGRTLGDVIDRYRIEVLPLKRSPNTRDTQGVMLTRLAKAFGHMLPDSVTPPMLYAYMDARRGKDRQPVPVLARHEVGLLGHVFAKAIRWGVTRVNPVRELERQPKVRRTRYVTDAEYAAVLKLANPRLRLAMELARITGQRRGDLLNLKRSQVTDAGILFRQGKTDAGVLVQWSPKLRKVVAACKALRPQVPGMYLLRTERATARRPAGSPYTAAGFSAMWQRLMERYTKAGGERFTFHDLRAKAASDMGSLEDAAALLGHASTETTKRVYRRTLVKAKAGR